MYCQNRVQVPPVQPAVPQALPVSGDNSMLLARPCDHSQPPASRPENCPRRVAEHRLSPTKRCVVEDERYLQRELARHGRAAALPRGVLAQARERAVRGGR
jgi:hypothetical protein